MHQYATLADTIYFWFAANDTAGSGADGATPVYDVRLAGAAAGDAPVLSGSATLLTHANYPAGAHEIAIAATAVNGFAANAVYAVFCTLLVDSQNPTGFVGSFQLKPVVANVTHVQGVASELMGEIDTGITLSKALEMLAAFMAGKVTESSAGGVTTYTFKKRDGSTTSFTSACTEADGTRATTGSLS